MNVLDSTTNRKRKILETKDFPVQHNDIWNGLIFEKDENDAVVKINSRFVRDKDRNYDMVESISFEGFPALKSLDLYKCRYIDKLHESIVRLDKLEYLRLNRCTNLKTLPDSIGLLTNLKHLDLTDSVNISGLPDSIGNLTRYDIPWTCFRFD